MNSPEQIQELAASLTDLHGSVSKLIAVLQANAHRLEEAPSLMDKLPLLDFYNDDLKRNIEALRSTYPD